MQAWQYDVVVWDSEKSWGGVHGKEGLGELLSQRGSDGWELVAVAPAGATGGGGFWLFFKQPKTGSGRVP